MMVNPPSHARWGAEEFLSIISIGYGTHSFAAIVPFAGESIARQGMDFVDLTIRKPITKLVG